jgi:acyl-coenzyme A thioesterase PaaI-like protein
MTPRRFIWVARLWPPFLAAGIRVLSVSPDWRHVRVRLRRHFFNANYVGTHFGGSLFAVTDPVWMMMVMENLGRDYVVWDKAAEIEFVAALKDEVFAEFRLDPAVLDELRAAAAGGDKVLRWFEVEVRTTSGVLAARVRKQVYVRLKARGKGRGEGPRV